MDGIKKTLVAMTAGLALPAAAAAQTVTFGNETVGASLETFESGVAGEGGPGLWQVVTDNTGEGGRALAQLSTETPEYRFLVAIYKPVVLADGEVTVRCKPVAGKVDQACGVILRAIDAKNYYIARANALEDNVRFYRVRNGQRQQLATTDNIKVASGQWHTLTLRAEDTRYTVIFNGRTLYTATDTTTGLPRPAEGRVGLWTKSDSVTHFDRIEIKPSPPRP